MKRNNYLGNPRVHCSRLPYICWDRANLHYSNDPRTKGIGPHALCDVDGNSLKLIDIKDGMYVKIRAKNVEWPGYEYLFTAYGTWGKYFAMCNEKLDINMYICSYTLLLIRLIGYAYYDVLRPNDGKSAHQKQTWMVKKDPSDGLFLFETTYWNRGNYLIASTTDTYYDPHKWLYCDDQHRGMYGWWNVASSVI